MVGKAAAGTGPWREAGEQSTICAPEPEDHAEMVEGMGAGCPHSSVNLWLEIYFFVISAEWRGTRFCLCTNPKPLCLQSLE